MKITKLPNGAELVEYNNGSKYWYLNNLYHREDGPAVEYSNFQDWYLHGKLLFCTTQKQFEQLMRLKAFW